MKLKLAFAGLRHGHAFSILSQAARHPEIEVVAVCEEDDATRVAIAQAGRTDITHTSIDEMLEDVACDIVAVGDYYGKRGSIAIRVLEAGKHVIGDKPLCTRLEEYQRIEELSTAKGLKVGCMFTMRDGGCCIGMRNLLKENTIGEVHAISFGGQHPLMLGSRPSWYFEVGKHGGTINDIGCHAVDAIPWMTGLEFAAINSARSWNAFATDYPHFHDAGQMMLTMDNSCGVLGDVSYFLPNGLGYSNPLYWRMTFFGRHGIIESSATMGHIILMREDSKSIEQIPLPDANSMGCLNAFVRDIQGCAAKDELSTKAVLKATRMTLMVQQAAENGSGSALS